MGIRISKQLGWVLKIDKNIDIKKLQSILYDSDETIGKFSKYLNKKYKTIKKDSLLDPIRELQIEIANQSTIKMKSPVYELFKIISDSNEKPKYIVISSILCADSWSRYDDAIDYLENTKFSNASTKVNFLYGREIFPYCINFLISSNLQKLSPLNKDRIMIFGNSKDKKLIKLLCKENKGLNPNKNLKNQIHLQAPEIIFELFDYLINYKKCSKTYINPQKLVPGIVTYWS